MNDHERRPCRRSAQRGFTLVELMVALTGGLFVSIAVFALARDGSRFYQRESRLANATLASVVGFERLRADLGRAGFLSTPNIFMDPEVCAQAMPGAAQLQNLASLNITVAGSPANTTLTAAGLTPASITLAGAYTSTDEFPVRLIQQSGSTFQIFLQPTSGAMTRLGYDPAAAAATGAQLLASVFATGRVLRVFDTGARQQFGIISGTTGGMNPSITLAASPALSPRSSGCGYAGNGTGSLVNVVNFIRYQVRNLSADPTYSAMYNAAVPYEATRTDLVREELNANGVVIPGTTELVAEYAIDLGFSFSAVINVSGGVAAPNLVANDVAFIAPGAANYAAMSGNVSTGATPQRIRSVLARLAVRSREADRDGPILVAGVPSPLYRIGLGSGNSAPYARVRTHQATIALLNQRDPVW